MSCSSFFSFLHDLLSHIKNTFLAYMAVFSSSDYFRMVSHAISLNVKLFTLICDNLPKYPGKVKCHLYHWGFCHISIVSCVSFYPGLFWPPYVLLVRNNVFSSIIWLILAYSTFNFTMYTFTAHACSHILFIVILSLILEKKTRLFCVRL